MQVTRNSLETTPGPDDWFTGAVFIDTVAEPSGRSRVAASNVHFAPGAHTADALGDPDRLAVRVRVPGPAHRRGEHVTGEEYAAAPELD